MDYTDLIDSIPGDPRGRSDRECCPDDNSANGLYCSREMSHDGPHVAMALYPSGYVRIQEVW